MKQTNRWWTRFSLFFPIVGSEPSQWTEWWNGRFKMDQIQLENLWRKNFCQLVVRWSTLDDHFNVTVTGKWLVSKDDCHSGISFSHLNWIRLVTALYGLVTGVACPLAFDDERLFMSSPQSSERQVVITGLKRLKRVIKTRPIFRLIQHK